MLPAASVDTEAPRVELPAAARGAVNRRVLVVDDNLDAAESLAMVLTFAGHEARQAHDGGEAVKAAEQFLRRRATRHRTAGDERLRRLPAAAQEPWVPSGALVALTGWGQQEDREQSRDAGLTPTWVEACRPRKLLDVIARSNSRVVS